MRHFLTILNHEVRMLLVTPSTYIAATLFLAVMGFFFTSLLQDYSNAPQEVSPPQVFFQLFWFPVLFMVPLLTMKCLAEERRLGTLETLLTTPVTTAEVILGKYAAAYLLYLSLWATTGGFFYILYRFAGDLRFIDPESLFGGYLFIAVSGLLFIAVGVFASALARNQAVAGILSFALLFALIFGGGLLQNTAWLEREVLHPAREALHYAQIIQHREDFARGIVDTRQLLFYLSSTTLALIFSILGVEAKLLHN
ncbi:hypothetical protein AXK11_02830 [Cephaloticoccus primus]|uniref:ABC transporter permease n=1 Tax=Cephaloticoccus primus TaxID=1548207 RepID=A0A139SRG0_9BACT|nr:ABC transporter permease subunit [Cephaloticoccus primus]KXU37127.1 hypothetical protein AXK11_02830 [Cephaloticoccus primus]